ncbi:MAG: Vitamin B12 dependent methionine synthase activation subunit [Lachnospiraceae bacterium]|nr:Vitamin B12 dependent methionine synthase activation subunit [Lachnospiraceae bacterium]
MTYETERLGKIPFEINRRELYIYAGYRGNATPDEGVLALIDECIEEVKAASEIRGILKWCKITRTLDEQGLPRDDQFSIGDFFVESIALGKNLRGCEDAILVGATLSPSIDLLLHRYAKLQITKSVLMQATAAAYIEAYLDEIQRMVKIRLSPEGLSLRPRFSPGFADFTTEYQKPFLDAIDAGRNLGITLANDSNMMVPSKSVTAVMGICKAGTEAVGAYENI